jgi:carboxypeptidase C (cathepsin A)
MLYSDAVVSHIETEKYIQTIGWKQLENTTVVKNGYGSMVAWRTRYDGLTYYVVNGAGHMVPADRPYAAERIFKEFLGS